MGERRLTRQRGAQCTAPASARVPLPPAAPPPEEPEGWWRKTRREALLIGGGFIGAVSFAGVLKVDEWLASWAARPVEMFRAVAEALFFWIPEFGFFTREALTTSLVLSGVILRGLFVEDEEYAKELFSPEGSFPQRIARLNTLIAMLWGLPILAALSTAEMVQSALGYDNPHWVFKWIAIGFCASTVPSLIWAYFRVAPRSTVYLLSFIALFYGWGLFVDGGYHKQLPKPEISRDTG